MAWFRSVVAFTEPAVKFREFEGDLLIFPGQSFIVPPGACIDFNTCIAPIDDNLWVSYDANEKQYWSRERSFAPTTRGNPIVVQIANTDRTRGHYYDASHPCLRLAFMLKDETGKMVSPKKYLSTRSPFTPVARKEPTRAPKVPEPDSEASSSDMIVAETS